MKPVISIVPLQSRTAATVSNARLQALADRARHAEGLNVPVGYVPDDSFGQAVKETERAAVRGLVKLCVLAVILCAVAAVVR